MPALSLTALDNRTVTITEKDFKDFQSSLRGPLLTSSSPTYNETRKVWNGMFDRKPGLIIQCSGPADVIAAVKFARSHNILVSVRGGGHSLPGHSVCNGGLMIDLSMMKGIRVDPKTRTAHAQGGCKWGDLDRETQALGLAVTGGQVSDTGIAGLTLGGGIGWLGRKLGLTCDNLLSADIITADGQFLTASAQDNADLFWAVRGGGGNFGVVTSFQYRLHPIGPIVLGGLVAYPLPEGKKVLRAFCDFMETAPEELGTTAALMTTPDGHQAVGIAVCYAGDISKGESVVAPLRKLGTVAMDMVQPMPYTAVQSMIDAATPPGRRVYMKSELLEKVDQRALDAMIDNFAQTPCPFNMAVLIPMGGAASRVGRTDTAFYHRSASYNMSVFSMWESHEDDEPNIAWTRRFDDAVKPYASGGFYVNEMVDEGDTRIKNGAYAPETYKRLAQLKKKYDPTNFFRLNQNIKPA
jgi:FAD/FMN-containing dehydrogenase